MRMIWRIRMKKAMIVMCLMAIAAIGCKKQISDKSITLQGMIGDVKVTSAGVQKAPAIGDVLKKGDIITTGEKSIVDLLIGTQGVIRIHEKSTINMAALFTEPDNDTQLDMNNGKVYVTLTKLSKGSFKIKTPTAVASVRGTSFRVIAGEGNMRLDVVKGAVKVNPVKDNAVVEDIDVVVEANQTTELDTERIEKIIAKKEKIEVITLKPDDMNEIKNEVKTIKSDVLEKVNVDVKKEIDDEVLQLKDTVKEEKDAKVDKDKEEKLALKKKRDDERKLSSEKAAKARMEKERLERESLEKERIAEEKRKKEQERKEKEKRERASNIPTL